jgi:hypothetical protein
VELGSILCIAQCTIGHVDFFESLALALYSDSSFLTARRFGRATISCHVLFLGVFFVVDILKDVFMTYCSLNF